MFEEEYRNRINRVVEFIEQNLESPITLRNLAEQAGVSPFHLHRLFLLYTGEPLAAFIRRTRLAAGYVELQKDRKASVLETAVAVGYESVSSFVRAFRRRFGLTPKLAGGLGANSLSLWRTQRSESEKRVLEPDRIELRVSQLVLGVQEIGYQNRSFQATAERAFARILRLVDRHRLHEKIGRACAIMFEDPDLSDPSEVRYFGGFEWLGTPDEPVAYEGLETRTLPSGIYAVFIHRGSYRTLWQTWNVAYRNWLPNSGHELRDAFPFEIYLNDPRTVKREKDLMTELYLPVERRSP